MKKTLKDKLSDKLVYAFLKNKIITSLPKKFTKKLTEADKFRKLCESKIKEPIIGSLILLSHIFRTFCASLSFLVYFKGRGEIILFFKKALTNLSESLSFNVFFIRLFYFNTDIGSSLV